MSSTESTTVSGQLNRQLCGILATAGALGQRCGLASVLAACVIASAGARAEDTLSIATWRGARRRECGTGLLLRRSFLLRCGQRRVVDGDCLRPPGLEQEPAL